MAAKRTRKMNRRGELVARPLVAFAFVLVQIVLPFASPFVMGNQASQTAYSVVTPPPPPPRPGSIDSSKNIGSSARQVSLQASATPSTTTAASPTKKRSFRQIASDLNPFKRHREYVKGGGECNATLPSRLLFRYASPLIDTASKRQLDESDAFNVSEKRKMESSVPRLKSIYNKCRSKARKKIEQQKQDDSEKAKTSQSLILAKALLLHQRRNLIYTGALRLLNTVIQAFPALLVARLLRLVESGDKNPPSKALTAAVSLVAVLTVKMIIENQYFHNVVKGATEVRGSLSGMIFDKSLRLPGGGGAVSSAPKEDGSKPSLGAGGVLNLMQSDASILEGTTMQLHTIWDGPLQIAIYTTLLYRLLGPSVLYGLAVLLLTIPLNSITLRILNRMSRYENEAKDARTKRTSESIANMKLLKLQAWEHSFEDDIRKHRKEELSRHATRGIIRAMNQAISNAVPALVLVVTLAAYARSGQPILASTIFTAISLFNQLRFPLFFYPMLIDSLANGKNALRRVSSYLSSEEITPYVELLPPLAGGQGGIEMKNGNFLWSTAKTVKDGEVATEAAPALCDVNLDIKPGEVVAVVGPVGSGKSALIKGLLGELAPVPRTVVDQSLKIPSNRTSEESSIFERPSVVSHGNIGYCSQEAWLPKGTIREAVVFGREYDEERYLNALRDAGLDRDIVDNVDGLGSKADASRGVLSSDTDVGEGGSSLSGGQRARVALARALYAGDDTKVFLFDDPLAALDASVGSTVFERVTQRLRRSKSATVLVTNDPSIPRRCDRVILMGRYSPASSSCSTIIDSGTYDQLLARGHDLRAMAAPKDDDEEDNAVEEDEEGGQADGEHTVDGEPRIEVAVKRTGRNTVRVVGGYEAPVNDTDSYYQCDPEPFDNCQSLPDYIADQVVPIIYEEPEATVIEEVDESNARNGTMETSTTASAKETQVSKPSLAAKKLTSIDDTMARGAVPLSTYVGYLKSVRGPLLIAALIGSFLTSNGAQFFQQYTVAKWTELGSGEIAAALGAKYLRSLVYAAGVVSVFLWLRSYLTMRVGVRASEFWHSRMLSSVFSARMSFFDATPSGQLLSRFGKEMETVDRAVPDSIGSVLFCFLQIFFSIGALAGVITPAMLVPLFAVGVLYTKTMGRFRPAARVLRVAESKSRSPIYTHFGEAIRGTEIIRSVPNASNLWSAQHQGLTDRNLSVLYAVKALDRWLSIRLETLGNIVVFTSAIASVFLTRAGKLKAGSAGWGLTQALSITGLLTWAVRTLTDLESHMLSVVRVEELSDLDADMIEGSLPGDSHGTTKKSKTPQESSAAGKVPTGKALPVAPTSDKVLLQSGWPWKGNIVFKNASMRYNEISPLVLKNVTLGVPPGTTLGVVGRTGSGKSSLLLTLFRLVELEPGGSIEIDGVDIRSVSIQGLRESLSIIPQDPVLFAGTVMYNLDATGRASPEDAWTALEAASPELATQFRVAGTGLDTYISEGGKNLSQGQRQLICLARALLRKSKILVMDEATSSVDSKTDAQVQETIRREFVDKGVTVITVAHRLDTVLGNDKICVLGDGYLLEYGSPKDLLKKRDGELKALVEADRLNKRKGAKASNEEVLVTA